METEDEPPPSRARLKASVHSFSAICSGNPEEALQHEEKVAPACPPGARTPPIAHCPLEHGSGTDRTKGKKYVRRRMHPNSRANLLKPRGKRYLESLKKQERLLESQSTVTVPKGMHPTCSTGSPIKDDIVGMEEMQPQFRDPSNVLHPPDENVPIPPLPSSFSFDYTHIGGPTYTAPAFELSDGILLKPTTSADAHPTGSQQYDLRPDLTEMHPTSTIPFISDSWSYSVNQQNAGMPVYIPQNYDPMSFYEFTGSQWNETISYITPPTNGTAYTYLGDFGTDHTTIMPRPSLDVDVSNFDPNNNNVDILYPYYYVHIQPPAFTLNPNIYATTTPYLDPGLTVTGGNNLPEHVNSNNNVEVASVPGYTEATPASDCLSTPMTHENYLLEEPSSHLHLSDRKQAMEGNSGPSGSNISASVSGGIINEPLESLYSWNPHLVDDELYFDWSSLIKEQGSDEIYIKI